MIRRFFFGQIRGREEGSSIIELAVTLPLMFTFLFCFMELCLMFYTRAMISESAREGVRYAMFHGGSCKTTTSTSCTATYAQVNAYVSAIGWPNVGAGTITPVTCYATAPGQTCSASNSEAVGNYVQVTVTYAFQIKMPFVPKNAITMSSSSMGTIVQ